MRILLAGSVLLFVLGCGSRSPEAPPLDAARPPAMLSGIFCGNAVLTKRDGTVTDRLTVTSFGRASGDGLILDQIIDDADGAPKRRRWTIQPDGPDSYRGTLTGHDSVAASGDVRAHVTGASLRLSYPIDAAPFARMTQTLTVQTDGTIANEGAVRVLGFTVRRLDETIVRQAGDLQPALAARDDFRCSADEPTRGS